MALPFGYQLRRRLERVQVILAWFLSYVWLLPYIFYNISLPFVLVSIVLIPSQELSGAIKVLLIVGIVFFMVMINVPAVHLLLKIRREFRAAKNLSNLELMPEPVAGMIKQRIDELAKRTDRRYRERIDRCFPRIFLERKNHKATPCMVVTAGILTLIFPLGFLKILEADPEAADAMLAHELAHYLHRDSGLLLMVRCYLKAARVILGYTIAGSILYLGLAAMAWNATYYQSEYERYVVNRGVPVSDVIFQAKLRFFLALTAQAGILAYYGLLFFYIRRRLHRSEMLADLLAAFMTGPKHVRNLLDNYVVDGEKSLHPPVAQRIKYLAKLERQLTKMTLANS